MEDFQLLGKLNSGDMIAQDAMYHKICLLNLYRQASSAQLDGTYTEKEQRCHGIAFSKLIMYIEDHIDASSASDIIPVMKLSDLVKVYRQFLEELGVSIEKRIHSTRLKNRILAQFDDISSHNEGKEVLLVFQRDIGAAVASAASIDYDDEGFILAKAAQILRRDILAMENEAFTGKFTVDCQEAFVPASVNCLISSVMRGGQANVNPNPYYHQSTLTTGQLMMFNTTIRVRKESSSQYRSTQREPPLLIYAAMKMHSQGRDLGLIEKFSSLGLCISKDRLQTLSVAMGNTAIESFEKTGVVAPCNLKKGLFVTDS